MTLVNVHMSADRIDFITDTLVYGASTGKPIRLTGPKAKISASRRFIISGQGLSLICDESRAVLANCGDVISAAGLAEELLRGVWSADLLPGEGQRITIAGLGDDGTATGFEVVLSPRDGVVRRVGLPLGSTLRPSPGDGARMPDNPTEDQMIRAALWQWRAATKWSLPMGVGGVIHRTTVTAAGAIQRIVAVTPDYADLVTRLGGDPCAGDVAAWQKRTAFV